MSLSESVSSNMRQLVSTRSHPYDGIKDVPYSPSSLIPSLNTKRKIGHIYPNSQTSTSRRSLGRRPSPSTLNTRPLSRLSRSWMFSLILGFDQSHPSSAPSRNQLLKSRNNAPISSQTDSSRTSFDVTSWARSRRSPPIIQRHTQGWRWRLGILRNERRHTTSK